MNYLAHAYLSFGDATILTGNMIADHVKGQKPLGALPDGIARGIRLHRRIDAFSDVHPAVAQSKVWFRDPYRLYAGAVLDTLWDHFLANDPAAFPTEKDFQNFTQRTYQQLDETAAWHPEAFARYFPYMKAQDWLYNYRNLRGVRRSLDGLGRRAQYIPPMDAAYEIFIGQYYQLSQAYFELMDGLKAFAKKELSP